MTNLKYGSTGDEVKKLQESLGFTGADVDGIFGDKTQQAVRDYQQKNGLDVNGIVGENTWGSLMKKSESAGASNAPAANQPASPTTSNTGSTGGFNYDKFSYADFDRESDEAFKQASMILQQHLGTKPGGFVSSGAGEKADAFLEQYQSREPFKYDINEDVLYQQMKDQYAMMGELGMMDTMGQAAALTGGYGNSYAQRVGQQTYQDYLRQFNDRLPEFYGMALDRHNAEGQKLLDMYSLYMDKENQEYGRHQDSLDAWYRENARLQGDVDTAYGRAWDKYLLDRETAYDDHQAGRDEAWQRYLQDQEDKRNIAELLAASGDFSKYQKLYGLTDEEVAVLRGEGTPNVTGGNDGYIAGYSAPDGWDRSDIQKFQRENGLDADGIWGPLTDAKYNELNRQQVVVPNIYAQTNPQESPDGKTSYLQVARDVERYLAAGTSPGLVKAYIQSAVGNGITEQDVHGLMARYFPKIGN